MSRLLTLLVVLLANRERFPTMTLIAAQIEVPLKLHPSPMKMRAAGVRSRRTDL